MSGRHASEPSVVVDEISHLLAKDDLSAVSASVAEMSTRSLVDLLERLNARQGAVVYRLLPKRRALDVFEALQPSVQGDLVQGLQDSEVVSLFADLDPDDRVWLLDELPASVAQRLLQGLPDDERGLTAAILGYPQDSIGRRMSPEYVATRPEQSVGGTLATVRSRVADAETVYTLPVVDDERRVVGVVSLRDLLGAEDADLIEAVMQEAHTATASEDAEDAARRCADLGVLALPVVDSEHRLVGILTIDDAVRILEREDSEDLARQGGVEPLQRPYLATPVTAIVRSRVVWLFVLAVGATLTVQVLSAFEDTLEQVTVLALFVPLLIGTGGNTGNQAATTVTRPSSATRSSRRSSTPRG